MRIILNNCVAGLVLAFCAASTQAETGSLTGNIAQFDWATEGFGAAQVVTDPTHNSVTWAGLENSGSFEMTVSGLLGTYSLYQNIGANYAGAADSDIQLRFSYWDATAELTLTRQSDGKLIKSTSFHESGKNSFQTYFTLWFADPSETYVIKGAYTFTPGHYLIPSNDPNCASLSCMIAKEDVAHIFSTINVRTANPIPEPSTTALMSLGAIALLALRGRRIRRSA
jgi:hypothetical protein